MNSSLSFDRAADIYDSTREFPEAVASLGVQAILETAGAGARMLDVGTGTGRVSIPLLRAGAKVIGCDISRKMMAVLQQKQPGAGLTQADASQLPFSSGHFDAVTTCHVMHLIGPWRWALDEFRRVLKRGGVYINARTEETDKESPGQRIHEFWEDRVLSYGASSKRPGVQGKAELHAALREMGAALEEVKVVRYSRTQSVRDVVDRIADRVDSPTWMVSEPVFSSTVRELREWVATEFGDTNIAFEEESAFILDIARFGGNSAAPRA
jgi:ubiquinone/menaquinone biosynthesis C-methylase UbiE